ncbi:unnamed protein product [Caenorhabditis sp. 36 PRJEB53466]|nr:unnamed protein product [Caenorhabditis sp. 36 PRJEB53466]
MSALTAIIQLLYTIPSFLLYFLTVAIVIIAWHNLKSSFFQFYLFEFVMNMLTFVNVVHSIRLPSSACADCFLFEYFQADGRSTSSFLNQLQYAMQFHMACVQYTTTAVVAINRLTITWNTELWERRWRRGSWIVMIIIFTAPFALTYPVFQHEAFFRYDVTVDRFSISSEYKSSTMFAWLVPIMAISAGITMLINIFNYFKFRKLENKPQGLETSLLTITFFASLPQILGAALSVLMTQATRDSMLFRGTNIALPYVSDLLTLIHPYLLLVFCKKPISGDPSPYAVLTLINTFLILVSSQELILVRFSATMWLFLFMMAYSIPSLILYFLTAYVVIKFWKTLKSSFFLWYIFDFVMNILTTCLTLVTLKVSSVTCHDCLLAPFYRLLEGTLVSNFLYAMMYHMSYVQNCTTAIVSLNRLTIILNHYTFEPLWTKYSFLLMIAVSVLPFFPTSIVFESNCTWYNRSDDSLVLKCDLPYGTLFTPLLYFQGLCIAISIISNITSAFMVRKASTEMRVKAEKNFVILISVTTFVQLSSSSISTILSAYSQTPSYAFFHTYILPIISDLFTIMHPWLLYILSKPIKRHILRDVLHVDSSSVDHSATAQPLHQPHGAGARPAKNASTTNNRF